MQSSCSPASSPRNVQEVSEDSLCTVHFIIIFFIAWVHFFFSYLFITVKVWTQYTHRRISYTWCVTNQFIVDLDKSTTEGYQRKTIGAETWSNIARWAPHHRERRNAFPGCFETQWYQGFWVQCGMKAHDWADKHTNTCFFFLPTGWSKHTLFWLALYTNEMLAKTSTLRNRYNSALVASQRGRWVAASPGSVFIGPPGAIW